MDEDTEPYLDDPFEDDAYGQSGPSLFGDDPEPSAVTGVGEPAASEEDDAGAGHIADEDDGPDDDEPDDDEPDDDDALLAASEEDNELSEDIVLPLTSASPSGRASVPRQPAVTSGPVSPPATPAAPPLALYRRYRPDTFADIIGQDHVTAPLQRALINNRVNHAYLFSGPRGCGKTTSARILARSLNCEQGPTPTPCGTCQSCTDLARGGAGSIDVIEIDAASHGGVEDARDLRERAFFSPMQSRYKVYIVDEAHMVTTAGFNALLKLVEEPPPHVKFIFATTEPDKVIGTIRSRTHHYPFRLVPPKTLGAYLGTICAEEGVAVEPAVLPLVVRAGAGSVRDSLSVLDQLLGAAGDTGVTYAQATALLGYTPDTLLDEIVDAFAAGDGAEVFSTIDRVIEVGQDPRRFAEDLLRRLRDLVIVAAVPDALTSGLVDVSADQAERLAAQAARLGAGELTRAAEVLADGLTDMRGTTAPRLHLEIMCARVLLPGADVDGRGVHARLDRLERRLAMGSMPSEAEQRPAPQRDDEPHAAERPHLQTERREERPSRDDASARRRPPSPRPSQSPPRVTRTPPQTSDAPAARGPAAASGAAMGVADIRRLWPQVLEEVKVRRRFTWMLLSQNAQVVDLRDGTLTIGMANSGARDSFGRGGSVDVLRESLIHVLGADLRIECIVDAGGGGQRAGRDVAADAAPRAPVHTQEAGNAAPSPAGRPGEALDANRPLVNGAAASRARGNIRPMRPVPLEAVDDDDPGVSRSDDDVVDLEAGTDELLATHLGAELIFEEDH